MEKKTLFEILQKHYNKIMDSLQINCISTHYKLIAYEVMTMLFDDDSGNIVDFVKEIRRGILIIMFKIPRNVFDPSAVGRILLKFDDLIDELRETERQKNYPKKEIVDD
jgi:hypothetical protein